MDIHPLDHSYVNVPVHRDLSKSSLRGSGTVLGGPS